MLIATVLSQNTNDKNSFKAYQNIKNIYSDWKDAVNAHESEIEEIIKPAGLKKQKARTIKTILSNFGKNENFLSIDQLHNMSNEEIFNLLIEIKGIGTKTISCLLLFSLGRNICPVDTHVHRVLNRIGIINTASPDKTFVQINKNLPEKIAHSLHTNLIKLGREICRPSKPVCNNCPLNAICKFKGKNSIKSDKLKLNQFMLLDNVSVHLSLKIGTKLFKSKLICG